MEARAGVYGGDGACCREGKEQGCEEEVESEHSCAAVFGKIAEKDKDLKEDIAVDVAGMRETETDSLYGTVPQIVLFLADCRSPPEALPIFEA